MSKDVRGNSQTDSAAESQVQKNEMVLPRGNRIPVTGVNVKLQYFTIYMFIP